MRSIFVLRKEKSRKSFIKEFLYSGFFTLVLLVGGTPVWADTTDKDIFPPDTYYRAKVIEVLSSEDRDHLQASEIVQQLRLTLLSGEKKGIEVIAQNNIPSNRQSQQKVRHGDVVVVVESYGIDGRGYYIVDAYRVPYLLILFSFFITLVLIFGRLRGLSSLIGLAFSILILAVYIVPRIASGHDPLVTSISGALVILIVSLYLAHGFSKRTSIALLSALVTLVCSSLLAIVFVSLARLFGTGTEDALFLQLSADQAINVKGLLLGGIIIGMLGVLDDITIGQVVTIDELRKADPRLSSQELYRRGISIGREHIASLVNTLALAYAGVALPLFLLFSMNASGQPLWVVINNESLAEEIVRTLVGSIALIFAVPLSTFFAVYCNASWFVAKRH